MDGPIILLAILGFTPSTLPEILREIEALRNGQAYSPLGASGTISRFAAETDGKPGPLKPFHTAESCAEGLQELVRLGLVKKDDAGYRLTYEGVLLTSKVVKKLRNKYGPTFRAPLPPTRELQPEPPATLSPLSQKALIEAFLKQLPDRRKK